MRAVSGWLLCGDGELEVLGLRAAGGDRDRDRLRSELLVPGGDLVGPRVEAGDRVLPVGARRREERMREDADVGAHPRMDVALHVEDVLRLVEHRARLL